MKGVVFTEFLDFVEETAGYATVDAMIERADPPSGGAYSAVGQYAFSELAGLVGALSALLETPAPTLIRAFGRHLFGRFAETQAQFFDETTCALSFIEGVESRIHVDVLKLYPDAQLPQISATRVDEDALRVRYSSCRPLGDLCLGLIEGCAAHFGETLDVRHAPTADGLEIEITRRAAAAA